MTLEQLKLRIEAEFPEAIAKEEDRAIYCSFLDPLDLGAAPAVVTFTAMLRNGEVSVTGNSFAYTQNRDYEAAQDEIERRILNLTGHQEIAIRRRFAGAAS